jgi:hypothetical protein
MNQHGESGGMAKRLRNVQKAEPARQTAGVITISRCGKNGRRGGGFVHKVASGAGFALLLMVAACAAPAPGHVSPGPATVATGQMPATILAIRPVPTAAPQGSQAILIAMGAPAGQTAGESEIILRTDQGSVLSVVQEDTAGLAPGGRVVVLTTPSLRLARPGYSMPGS